MMKKMTNRKKNEWCRKAKMAVVSAAKVMLATVAIMLGMKLLGNVMEIVSNHVSVGMGIFVVFAAACFFIHMDTKNSIEQSGEKERMIVSER